MLGGRWGSDTPRRHLRQGPTQHRLATLSVAKMPGHSEAVNQAREGSGCNEISYEAFLQSGGAD